jgi:sulfite reductase (ferredoxin)
LGISSSRGLAAELRNRLAEKSFAMDAAVQNLHIKISGCFNSCGQHHVADLGFYGVSRKKGGYAVPHFQVVLGGEWDNNAGAYGQAVVAVPSKNIPQVVTRLTGHYSANCKSGESFQDFVKRIGKVEIKTLLEDLTRVPTDGADRSFFSDWGDPREYSLDDLGVGECAGEVVSAIEFDLAAAEREVFEAELDLENGNFQQAARTAYLAMIRAATALVKLEVQDAPNDPDRIVREFTTRFYDTQRFFDPFAGGKFAQYLFAAHASSSKPANPDSARYLIDEAQLFIDASHACYNRLGVVTVA